MKYYTFFNKNTIQKYTKKNCINKKNKLYKNIKIKKIKELNKYKTIKLKQKTKKH